MKIIGITNRLASNMRLFMWEYDDIEEYAVLEEANYISQIFSIDIDIYKSSCNCYHLISFDVLTLDMVERIQNYMGQYGDYLTVKESPLYGDERRLMNALRLGKKFRKSSPVFVKRFLAKPNTHLKSLKHFRAYQFFCMTPDYPLSANWVNLDAEITIYRTGIGAKPKPLNLEDSLLKHAR